MLRRGYGALAEAQRRAQAPENQQFGPLPSEEIARLTATRDELLEAAELLDLAPAARRGQGIDGRGVRCVGAPTAQPSCPVVAGRPLGRTATRTPGRRGRHDSFPQ